MSRLKNIAIMRTATKRTKNIFLTFMVFSLIISCNQKKNTNLKRIKIEYTPEHVLVISDVSCQAFDFEFISLKKEIVIEDNRFLNEVNFLTRKLTENNTNNNSIDIRIKAFLYYERNKIDTICFGELEGIVFNGARMEENTVLSQYFKDKVWK